MILPLVLMACSRTDEIEEPPQDDSAITQSKTTSSKTASSKEKIADRKFEVVEAHPNLTFEKPLGYVTLNSKDLIAFVVEQTGKISYFENQTMVKEKTTFIDLSSKISTAGGEMGLLGLAFHPDFEQTGYFFVHYTTDFGSVIARFKADQETLEVELDTETILLTFPQPYANHNGGQLAFGPDGYLYIGVGDGGGSGDPDGNAQDLTELYGKVLRIDVDQTDDGKSYGIPADNPFVENKKNYREEIYAYGLRNPWRFSFDAETERLWLADVGQNKLEEINWIEKGQNYGWNIKEGTSDFNPSGSSDFSELIHPVLEYPHSEGKSVTGGYVYYGQEHPELKASYIYGDFISGKIWGLSETEEMSGVKNTELADTDLMISSFGVTQDGEIMIVDYNGKLYKLE